MEEIQKEKEQAGKEERLEKKEPRKLFMRWTSSLWGKHSPRHNLKIFFSQWRTSIQHKRGSNSFFTWRLKTRCFGSDSTGQSHTITFYLLFKLNKKDGQWTLMPCSYFSKGVQASRHAGASIRSGANLYQVFSFACNFAPQMWRYWLELSSRLNLRSKIFQLRLPNEVK